MDLRRQIVSSFIELGAPGMLDGASRDDRRERVRRCSFLSCRLGEGGSGVRVGGGEVAALLGAHRIGKALLDFVRSFIAAVLRGIPEALIHNAAVILIVAICIVMVCSGVHLPSKTTALRVRATSGFNRAAQHVLILAAIRVHRRRHGSVCVSTTQHERLTILWVLKEGEGRAHD